MTETLFHAYLPLILWTGLGLLLFRFLPQTLPRLLGRGLYWVGIPLEILALARKTNFSESAGLAPAITLTSLALGCSIASLSLWGWQRLSLSGKQDQSQSLWLNPAAQGSFILASVLGNTGFVGLAIAPAVIDHAYLNWIVFYSITHNIVGIYVLGVLVASYFGHVTQENHWWVQLRDVSLNPTLWAFFLGYLTQPVQLPEVIESGLQASINIVIACAFLLTGMRLCQIQGWKSLQRALVPAGLRVIVIPSIVGVVITLLFGLSGDRCLAMVLMSGMPSAFAGLILAEEYNLERDLVAGSIVASTVLLLLVLPLWLLIFRSTPYTLQPTT